MTRVIPAITFALVFLFSASATFAQFADDVRIGTVSLTYIARNSKTARAAIAEVEAVLGSTGQALTQFSGGRLLPLGAAPPSPVERFIAEWQLGDPRGSGDVWRPWKRLNRTQRPR